MSSQFDMGQINYSELQKHRRKFLLMEEKWAKTQQKLLSLPVKLGFDSVDDLIQALREAAKDKGVNSSAPLLKVRRKRQEITPTIMANVKSMVAAGATGKIISEKLKISLPSVNNIKKKLGLVKPRKK